MDTGFGLPSCPQIMQTTQIQSLRRDLERPEGFFAEFTLERELRSFASLRMTAREGLRMTEREGLS